MNGDGDEEFRAFVDLHARALQSSGVPQIYWRSLHHKITSEVCFLLTNMQPAPGSVIHTRSVGVGNSDRELRTNGTGLPRLLQQGYWQVRTNNVPFVSELSQNHRLKIEILLKCVLFVVHDVCRSEEWYSISIKCVKAAPLVACAKDNWQANF